MAEETPQEQLEDLILSIPQTVMSALERTYVYRHNYVAGNSDATLIMLGEAKLVLDLLAIRASGRARHARAVVATT